MDIPLTYGPVIAPPDIETMRETAALLLGPDTAPEMEICHLEELDTLTVMLRGHLALLITEAGRAIGRLPKTSGTRNRTAACIGEARRKLTTEPSGREGGLLVHARRLARVLRALCAHYENAEATEVP